MNDIVYNIDGITDAEGHTWVFFLNVCCAVVFPTIPSSTFLPNCCQSQFAVASGVTPDAIMCSVEFPPKGLLGVGYSRASSVFAMSISCRAFETSLCWSFVVYDTSVSSCIAQFT